MLRIALGRFAVVCALFTASSWVLAAESIEIWDRLDEITRQRMIDYLAPVVGDDTYPKNNWLWFRLVVQTFLRSVGGPWSRPTSTDGPRAARLLRPRRRVDLRRRRALVRPLRRLGAAPLPGAVVEDAGRRRARGRPHRGRHRPLDRFLQDAIALVGADGSPLIQGRSLIYRFAAAAPFWAG